MTDQRYLPEVLFEYGYTDLISVVPPGATISPGSKLQPSQLGKVPGRRNRNGTWGGYDWRHEVHTVDDVRQWMLDGANVGIRADNFPAVDIDCLDQALAAAIEAFTLVTLGWAPVRFGRRPKRLLMYSTSEPFGRLRLYFTEGDTTHLVEILGSGQQYLMYGVHPSSANYEWTSNMREVLPDALTPITQADAIAFRQQLADWLAAKGFEVSFEGDGKAPSAVAPDQLALRAPSMDAIHEAMSFLPNDNDTFGGRQDWLDVAYALKAAAGFENEHEARELFLEWSLKWQGNDTHPAGNDAGQVLEEFRRVVGPFRLGWNWLAERAREFGYNNASDDFEALDPAPAPAEFPEPPAEDPNRATKHTEMWLAEEVVRLEGERMRFVSEDGSWYFWTGKLWEKDARGKVMQTITGVLRTIGKGLMGISDKSDKKAIAIQLNSTKNHVEALVRHAPSIALAMRSFDANPWVLNTPDGIVDLLTGKMLPADPAALCSKMTAVSPDFGGPCPEWRRFVAEATNGDRDLEAYLQRLSGYCLTGVTSEQKFVVFHGQGGQGKGTFKNALTEILGSYAETAEMDTFVEQAFSRHSTDVASLAGARLVTATEVNNRQKLDAARLKLFSGEDRVKARFMRQDNFTFEPQFKLILLMNLPPIIREIGKAMRRRLHLVPFLNPPAVVDMALRGKLTGESAAIFAWMIEGCLAWRKLGLAPPPLVQSNTDEFFEDGDHIGRWLKERLADEPKGMIRIEDLWNDYNEWASGHGLPTVRGSHHFSRDLKAYTLTFGKNARAQSVIRDKAFRPRVASSTELEVLP